MVKLLELSQNYVLQMDPSVTGSATDPSQQITCLFVSVIDYALMAHPFPPLKKNRLLIDDALPL